MIEKEKVKIGLQCIIDGTVRCESCGYAIDKHGHHSCQQNCASDALALLKEQEAVEPTFKQDKNGIFVWACGSCGAYMYHIYDGIDKANEYAKYCRQCGRKVKWNEFD